MRAAEDAQRRVTRGLAEAGLDPKDLFRWDRKRPPYPGLMAFQEADAPVIFGRDREIQDCLDRLHNHRRYGGKALLLVVVPFRPSSTPSASGRPRCSWGHTRG